METKEMNPKLMIIIAVLCVALIAESIFIVVKGIGSKNDQTQSAVQANTQYSLTLSLDGLGESIGQEVSGAVKDMIKSYTDTGIPKGTVSDLVKKFVYSDTIINALMTVSYPLLLRVLNDINMLTFATEAKLYATPKTLAPLFEGKTYTCCNSDGVRMPLSKVLSGAGDNWTYFDKKINWTNTDGKTMNTTIWNTVKWNVTNEETFYSALNDMSEGLRGVLEVCLQNNPITVNVNVSQALTGNSSLPIQLDAAVLFNSTGTSGYKSCIIPLFNMLGLIESEYVSDTEFKSYTNLGDMWKAILGGVIKVIEKTEKDPINGLLNMLVNFASSMDNGTLVNNIRTLKLDADFDSLATLAMGYQDGLLSNLGELIIELIESLGIDFTHGFNALLDSLPGLIPSIGKIDIPDMEVSKLLAGAQTKTLTSGNKVYVANKDNVINYLIEYVIDEKLVQIVFDKTNFLTEQEEASITSALSNSKQSLSELVKVITNIAVSKLESATLTSSLSNSGG